MHKRRFFLIESIEYQVFKLLHNTHMTDVGIEYIFLRNENTCVLIFLGRTISHSVLLNDNRSCICGGVFS